MRLRGSLARGPCTRQVLFFPAQQSRASTHPRCGCLWPLVHTAASAPGGPVMVIVVTSSRQIRPMTTFSADRQCTECWNIAANSDFTSTLRRTKIQSFLGYNTRYIYGILLLAYIHSVTIFYFLFLWCLNDQSVTPICRDIVNATTVVPNNDLFWIV